MERLTEHDLRALLAFLGRAYEQPDLDTFARLVVETMPGVVRAQRVSYNEIHPRLGTVRAVVRPVDPYPWLNGRQYREHPMMQRFVRTRDGRAHKFSDFLTREDLHRTAVYQEYYRRVGVEHQMAIFLTGPGPRSVGFALGRDEEDFDERDRLVLNVMRPHLATAYGRASATARLRSHLALLARAGETAAVGVVLLDRDGRIDHSTRRARRWLRDYFPRGGRSSMRLPAEVASWLTPQTVPTTGHDLTAPPQPLVVTRGDRTLVIHLAGAPGARALLLEASGPEPTPATLVPLGLTARENEVLALLARGASNDGIARTLGTRPRTIAKHVERIHKKLGVDDRAAAAARAHDIAVSSRLR